MSPSTVVPTFIIEGYFQGVTRSGDGEIHPFSQQRADHCHIQCSILASCQFGDEDIDWPGTGPW